ncbi:hypothetical protein K490DRAFT_56458 [Saccharata proteae CBS 121410]|uniref:Fungal N-terminal domain-containing protein n=1 Tax=Saccharata proteae CBS 121410 TaxID=1314787 RepID=A0A9P4HTR9_9PEZI|nr:hypothetical protein K490DRAFT_56458 [Saccharata proteae CBS 121410]
MDPLTLTAAIVSLSWKAFEIGKEFNDLRLKYKEADATIDAICIEAEVVHVSLSRVRRLFENGAPTRPKSDELYMIFDTAVTGCDAVLSCLNEEVKKLKASASQSGTFGWKVRAKFIWKEEAMADLLNKLRGQRGAISLLFQSLQMESLSEIHHLLSDRAADFNQYEQDTNHLREKYPDIKISESVLGMQRKPFTRRHIEEL